MKVLVIGGNRFFGKKLTAKLIKDGCDVTLLNRGNMDDGFGDKISRIKCDRTNFEQINNALSNTTWDLVYDQVCYNFDEAKQACLLFNSKTKKYIHTSTASVYETNTIWKESDYRPELHKFDTIVTDRTLTNYGEGKRQAEAAFAKYAEFDLVMLRIPIVVGLDDYTERLSFHINKVKNEEPFYMPNKDALVSFITSDDTADVLFKLGKSDFTGIINAACPTPITLNRFINILEDKFNTKANFLNENISDELHSPYGFSEDCVLSTTKLDQLDIRLIDIENWFKELTI